MAMILYDFETSADCYKARLLLSMLGRSAQIVPVDVEPGREHLSDWFTSISPDGTLPVLRDGETTVFGASAVLQYLAARHNPAGAWTADGAEGARWLDCAEALGRTSGAARWTIATGEGTHVPALQKAAHGLLRTLDEHLWFGEREERNWLAGGARPSIADIAVFAEVILCEEAGVSRQDYPALRRWTDRVRRIAGFVVMSGVFPAGSGLHQPAGSALHQVEPLPH